MASLSFAQHMQDFRTMAAGINTRLASLSSVNIVADDAENIANYALELEALNAQQEDLKAQLKTKTEQIDNKMAEAKAKHAQLSKLIKAVVPQEEWVAFGIRAKR